ncbi:type II toxin-antitoxin system RelE/ParE family toxin [Bifidobacterium stellenboschense]|uniref:RelE/StbE family addiction module toxin n=1 Tax=Bifidobacterium stellenboschense TaxID=762211 RepID=A0A087DUA3_9BIFI|nr:type II toxin-antitoxin system RelE/ParE family toxin [Bifidobacterium stellenboschense]KFI99103.1 RelE/StbE family addiction module toxin [Bifidobacterium stellenboschense]
MYEVEILPRALGDMNEAVSYIARTLHSPNAAQSLAVGLNAAIEGLSEYPYSHPAYVPIRSLRHEYRRIMVGNYAVFYWVDEAASTVTVARVVYAKRDLNHQLR